MMKIVCTVLLLVVVSCRAAEEPQIHECINDKVQPSLDEILHLSRDKAVPKTGNPKASTRKKRSPTDEFKPIRIHTVLHSTALNKGFFRSSNGPLQKALSYLSNALIVNRRNEKLNFDPMCKKPITSGKNAGKCKTKPDSNMKCGLFSIPNNLIGSIEVCKHKSGSCKLEGPGGEGVDTDFVLFAGADDDACSDYTSVLAFAAVCGVDNEFKRPGAGYINICYKNLQNNRGSLTDDIIYNIIMHELTHALGFTSTFMQSMFYNQQGNIYNPVKQFNFNGKKIPGITSPKVLKYAREYYKCPSLQYVPLEDGGSSGSASSHWEARILNHEMLMPFLANDYMVYSNFTLAFFEDSGWYKVNYTYTNSFRQFDLNWGKGKGCDFVLKPCTDMKTYPYICDTDHSTCTFDHVSKGTCNTWSTFFDGCKVVIPTTRGSCIHQRTSNSKFKEVFGETSRCYEHKKSVTTSDNSLSCWNTTIIYHSDSGITGYKVQTADNLVLCEEGKHIRIAGRFVYCPPKDDIAFQYPNTQMINESPQEFCHEDCATCNTPMDSSQCTACHNGFELAGPSPNTCCNTETDSGCDKPLTVSCTNGDTRLTNGISKYDGRVEVCVNGQWGQVCHNYWSRYDAIVACKKLGYSPIGAATFCCSMYEYDTTLPVILDRLRCIGTEDTLLDCPSDNSNLESCKDSQIAGLQCSGPCEEGKVVLTGYLGSFRSTNGIIMLCLNSVLTTICDYNWDYTAASLACKDAGLSPYGAIAVKSESTHNVLYDELHGVMKIVNNCEGKTALSDCKMQDTNNCTNGHLAGVVCQVVSVTSDDCAHGDVRLVGSLQNEGESTVEICINKIWGTVCSYGWDSKDATVVCRQLGYTDGVQTVTDSLTGSENRPVLFNFVDCQGSETKLIECSFTHYSYCPNPAAVSCNN